MPDPIQISRSGNAISQQRSKTHSKSSTERWRTVISGDLVHSGKTWLAKIRPSIPVYSDFTVVSAYVPCTKWDQTQRSPASDPASQLTTVKFIIRSTFWPSTFHRLLAQVLRSLYVSLLAARPPFSPSVFGPPLYSSFSCGGMELRIVHSNQSGDALIFCKRSETPPLVCIM